MNGDKETNHIVVDLKNILPMKMEGKDLRQVV